jgi:hypothetical protein
MTSEEQLVAATLSERSLMALVMPSVATTLSVLPLMDSETRWEVQSAVLLEAPSSLLLPAQMAKQVV